MQRKEQAAPLLQRLGLQAWNEMQLAAYKSMGRPTQDVVLLAPTGSGKTLAYLVPLAAKLKSKVKGVQALILAPSRELALQIEQVWKSMDTGFKVNSFYGGHDMPTEIRSLSEPPALLIGTPGRIGDHMERGTLDVAGIHTLVLDEFDKSLALGFQKEMAWIIGRLEGLQQRILVSATSAIEIPEFTGLQDAETLNFTESGASEQLIIREVISPEKDKIHTLFKLLCQLGGASTLIFCNHRESVERTSHILTEMGIENAAFHGGMEQMQREQTLVRFRNGSVHFLVATDLAARGLDITGVEHVIHYHLPQTSAEWTHRNGRTARQQGSGTAFLIRHAEEALPRYLLQSPELLELTGKGSLPATPEWATVFISAGRKDKVNKVDIVGLFTQKGKLAKEELGLLEVKDHVSFAAVRRSKLKGLLAAVRNEKLKGSKYKIELAR